MHQPKPAKIDEVQISFSPSVDNEASLESIFDVKIIFEFKIDGMTCVNCS